MKKTAVFALGISLFYTINTLGMQTDAAPKTATTTLEQSIQAPTNAQETLEELPRQNSPHSSKPHKHHHRTLTQLELELAQARAQLEKETKQVREIEEQLKFMQDMCKNTNMRQNHSSCR